jgi:hypothetical protein
MISKAIKAEKSSKKLQSKKWSERSRSLLPNCRASRMAFAERSEHERSCHPFSRRLGHVLGLDVLTLLDFIPAEFKDFG